jgi:hypothetical protein
MLKDNQIIPMAVGNGQITPWEWDKEIHHHHYFCCFQYTGQSQGSMEKADAVNIAANDILQMKRQNTITIHYSWEIKVWIDSEQIRRPVIMYRTKKSTPD